MSIEVIENRKGKEDIETRQKIEEMWWKRQIRELEIGKRKEFKYKEKEEKKEKRKGKRR